MLQAKEVATETAPPVQPSIVDEDLWDESQVRRFFGGTKKPISKSTLFRGVRVDRYPAAVQLGPQVFRWLSSKCREYRAKLIGATTEAA